GGRDSARGRGSAMAGGDGDACHAVTMVVVHGIPREDDPREKSAASLGKGILSKPFSGLQPAADGAGGLLCSPPGEGLNSACHAEDRDPGRRVPDPFPRGGGRPASGPRPPAFQGPSPPAPLAPPHPSPPPLNPSH